MRISQAAVKIGVSPCTLRILEKRGVICAARRAWNGYRNFSEDEVAMIREKLFPRKEKDNEAS